MCFLSLLQNASILECIKYKHGEESFFGACRRAWHLLHWISEKAVGCQHRNRSIPSHTSSYFCELLSVSLLLKCAPSLSHSFLCVCVCTLYSSSLQTSHFANVAQHPNPAPQVLRIKANNEKVLPFSSLNGDLILWLYLSSGSASFEGPGLHSLQRPGPSKRPARPRQPLLNGTV